MQLWTDWNSDADFYSTSKDRVITVLQILSQLLDATKGFVYWLTDWGPKGGAKWWKSEAKTIWISEEADEISRFRGIDWPI